MKLSDIEKSDKFRSIKIPNPGKKTMSSILSEIQNSDILSAEIDNEALEVSDGSGRIVEIVPIGTKRITLELIPKKRR